MLVIRSNKFLLLQFGYTAPDYLENPQLLNLPNTRSLLDLLLNTSHIQSLLYQIHQDIAQGNLQGTDYAYCNDRSYCH